MLPFKLVYSDDFYLPIGEHVFPAHKYRLINRHLIETGGAGPEDFIPPPMATDEDVLLVHTHEWVDKLRQGTLSAREELQLEVPFSHELVEKFWVTAGGSILAARLALEDKIGINIGGGFHHAFPDHGEGFCMIHDVAIAIRRLQKDNKIARAMTVDCDVHQGNGTAAIFGASRVPAEPLPSWSASMFAPPRPASMREAPANDVFTISLHQENNYPAWKPPSSIDINLPDGTSDDEYLEWLDQALGSGLRQFQPDLICYLAGADAYREDQLGGLGLTIDGLKRRDALVFNVAKSRGIPIMVTFAGGYAFKLEDTVTIHCNTVIAAREIYAPADLPAKLRS
jgi:acetoin utilization deacetylase AcuC-like enzyme